MSRPGSAGAAVASVAFLAATLGSPTVAEANPMDLFGFGPRSAALAGACTAACADGSANYHNPAALAAVRKVELAIGYTMASFDLKLNRQTQPVDDSRGVLASVVMPVKVAGMPVAFGTGVFLPDRRLTRVRALPARQPRWVLYDNKPQRLFVAANLAIEPIEGLQIGAGITYMAATRGTVTLEGEIVVPDPDGDRTSLVSSMDVGLEAIRYPSLGVRWTPSPGWALGLTWRDEFSLDLDLTTTIKGDIILASDDGDTPLTEGAELKLRSTNRVLFSPHQVVFGLAAPLADGLRLSADLAWARWSTFPTPAATVTTSIDLGTLDLDLSEAFPISPAPPPPKFKDTWSPRLGIEVDLPAGLTGRLGYAFEPSPAPLATGAMNLVDGDRQVASLGVAWEIEGPVGPIPGPVVFEAHASKHTMAKRIVLKSDPSDPVGDYISKGEAWNGSGWVRARF